MALHLERSALIIRRPYSDQVLAGTKTWELRTRATHKRGLIGLIATGCGCAITGPADGSIKPGGTSTSGGPSSG